jgi:hypothetical protein
MTSNESGAAGNKSFHAIPKERFSLGLPWQGSAPACRILFSPAATKSAVVASLRRRTPK